MRCISLSLSLFLWREWVDDATHESHTLRGFFICPKVWAPSASLNTPPPSNPYSSTIICIRVCVCTTYVQCARIICRARFTIFATPTPPRALNSTSSYSRTYYIIRIKVYIYIHIRVNMQRRARYTLPRSAMIPCGAFVHKCAQINLHGRIAVTTTTPRRHMYDMVRLNEIHESSM